MLAILQSRKAITTAITLTALLIVLAITVPLVAAQDFDADGEIVVSSLEGVGPGDELVVAFDTATGSEGFVMINDNMAEFTVGPIPFTCDFFGPAECATGIVTNSDIVGISSDDFVIVAFLGDELAAFTVNSEGGLLSITIASGDPDSVGGDDNQGDDNQD